MTKPRLAKVRALFYVLQQLIKRGCAYFDTASSYCFSYTRCQICEMRARYLPMMSNSMFTLSPGRIPLKLVCSKV